jgi:hypothetical protein
MSQPVDVAVRDWCKENGYRWPPQNGISGGVSQKFNRPSSLSMADFFKDLKNDQWCLNIEGPSEEENQSFPPEEPVEPETQEVQSPSEERFVPPPEIWSGLIRKTEELSRHLTTTIRASQLTSQMGKISSRD